MLLDRMNVPAERRFLRTVVSLGSDDICCAFGGDDICASGAAMFDVVFLTLENFFS